MKGYLLRIYFKGGVLVPFYFSCFLTVSFFAVAFVRSDFKSAEVLNDAGIYEITKITFFSGLTGLCSLTAFFNTYKIVAGNIWYSLVSWFLLPYSFIVYVLYNQVDWIIFKDSRYGDVVLSSLYLFTFFLHFIGLIIGFQSFRATVLLNRNRKEVLNGENDRSLEQIGDKDRRECNATKAK